MLCIQLVCVYIYINLSIIIDFDFYPLFRISLAKNRKILIDKPIKINL